MKIRIKYTRNLNNLDNIDTRGDIGYISRNNILYTKYNSIFSSNNIAYSQFPLKFTGYINKNILRFRFGETSTVVFIKPKNFLSNFLLRYRFRIFKIKNNFFQNACLICSAYSCKGDCIKIKY